MPFSRTASGLVAKYRFYDLPTVWVEGPSDVQFFRPLLDLMGCRIEPFYGKENADALVQGLKDNDYPYAIIFDGDYDILRRPRSAHRRIIILRRYSIENYLWEKQALERATLSYARCGDNEDILKDDFESAIHNIQSNLYNLIIMDIASRLNGCGLELIPEHPDSLLLRNRAYLFDPDIIDKRCNDATRKLDKNMIDDAKGRLDKYLIANRLVDILKGHFAFGILRKIFIEAVHRKRGKKPMAEDNAIAQILIMEMWRIIPARDHRLLKGRIAKAIREARRGLIEGN